MHLEDTDPAERAAALIDRLGRLVRASEQAAGLTPVQWEVLRYLARANRFSRSPAIVAEFLGSTRGTVSQTLIVLEGKGYVERRQSARDRRSVALSLTQAGREMLRSDPLLSLAAGMAGVPTGEAEAVARSLERVLDAMLARNGRRAFGECRTCRHFRQGDGPSADLPHRCGLLRVGLSDPDGRSVCVEHERHDRLTA